MTTILFNIIKGVPKTLQIYLNKSNGFFFFKLIFFFFTELYS